jgi:penicillin-binding protein 2
MASYPTFSLISFNADYAALIQDTNAPLFNRAVAGTYAPGSAMKMSTALAILEAGIATPNTRIVDNGIYMAYASVGYTPMCGLYRSHRQTHGALNAADAIKVSCNYYFYETADRSGIEPLVDMARRFGLGQPTGIELPGERFGILAGPEDRARTGRAWNPGDTLQAAIGQSENLFTPLQLANFTATLANGGTRHSVSLLQSVKSSDFNQQILDVTPVVLDTIDASQANWRAVMQGMRAVCQPGGSANHIFGNYPIPVAGKTGSAQVGGKTNGIFVAFAPYDDPQIAVAVIVERGDSGGTVAPIARDVFDAYFALAGEGQTNIPEGVLLR